MKILIASDIHGDINSAQAVVNAYMESGADRLLLLGDILYHGPRNDLPENYAPKEVISLLNSVKDELLCVRGNCDTEVDQMVLEFPILADYAFIEADGVRMFATHGHKFNLSNLPPLKKGDVLLHGHTHVSCAIPFGNSNTYINPGSVTIPKESTPRGYILFEKGVFSFRALDGQEYMQYTC
ncbi:MAG: phosphodiesterase [Clostridia bacterium]|nr:phosphodiesterase [Clostridia bacterium]